MTLDKLKVARNTTRIVHSFIARKEKFLERKQSYLKHAQSLTETTKSAQDNLSTPPKTSAHFARTYYTFVFFTLCAHASLVWILLHIVAFWTKFLSLSITFALTLKVFIRRESGPLCQDDICVTAHLTSSSIRQTSDITDCSCNVL